MPFRVSDRIIKEQNTTIATDRDSWRGKFFFIKHLFDRCKRILFPDPVSLRFQNLTVQVIIICPDKNLSFNV